MQDSVEDVCVQALLDPGVDDLICQGDGTGAVLQEDLDMLWPLRGTFPPPFAKPDADCAWNVTIIPPLLEPCLSSALLFVLMLNELHGTGSYPPAFHG